MTKAGNARFLDRAGEYAGFIYFIIILMHISGGVFILHNAMVF